MKMSALKSMTQKTKERRKNVIGSLEKQLASGKKPNKNATTKEKKSNPDIPLLAKDIERINKEIQTLKTRI